MSDFRGGLVDANAWCTNCGKSWGKNNAFGLAAKHAKKTGHIVIVELGYHYTNAPREEKEKTNGH